MLRALQVPQAVTARLQPPCKQSVQSCLLGRLVQDCMGAPQGKAAQLETTHLGIHRRAASHR